MKNRSKLIVLGVGIAYLIIGIAYYYGKLKIPMWLQVEIAFSSFSITLLECFKIFSWKSVEIADKLVMSITKTNKQSRKRMKQYNMMVFKISEISTALQTVLITIIIVISPLAKVKNNESTQRYIMLLTILTFAILFISVFLGDIVYNEWIDERKKKREKSD